MSKTQVSIVLHKLVSTLILSSGLLSTAEAGSIPRPAPPSAAPLVLRLDASDASTLTVDGSNLVQAWDQRFGQTSSMGPLTANTGETPPTYNPAGLNGMGTLEFDGQTDSTLGTVLSADYGSFINAGPANGNQYSIFFVAEQAAGIRGTTFAHGVGFGSGGFAFRNDPNNFSYRRGSFTTFNETDTVFKVRSVVSPDGAGLLMGIGGVETPVAVTDHVPLDSTGKIIVGGRDRDAGRDPATGSIAEIAIFNSALDADTRAGINQVLADKWGLAGPGATPEQIALGQAALEQPLILPQVFESAALYEFNTAGDFSPTPAPGRPDISNGTVNPSFLASDISSGGSELASFSVGEPPQSLYLGVEQFFPGSGIFQPTWNETTEPSPANSSTQYFEWTVTPNGLPFFGDTIEFALFRGNLNALDSWALYVDEDLGPGGDNFSTKIAGDTTSSVSAGDFEQVFGDISEVDLVQGLLTPLTFRLYLWHDGPFEDDPPGTQATTLIDNIRITSLIVPEPTSLALLLAAGLGLAASQGRRKL